MTALELFNKFVLDNNLVLSLTEQKVSKIDGGGILIMPASLSVEYKKDEPVVNAEVVTDGK